MHAYNSQEIKTWIRYWMHYLELTLSLIIFQITRVISSPSISTTGPSTLIFVANPWWQTVKTKVLNDAQLEQLFICELAKNRRLRSTGTCLENIKLNSFATLAVREIILTILRLLMKFKRRQRSKRSQNTASSKKRNSRISCNCRHFWKKEAFCTRVLETTRVSWTFVSSYTTSYFVLS